MRTQSKTVTIILLSVMLAATVAPAAANKEETLTGVVSDSTCGASHMAKNKTAAECTRMCVKDGSKYALVVGEKVYTLTGHETELDKLAGEKASIKGDVSGTNVKVSSVKAASNE